MKIKHTPVLLEESIVGLNLKEGLVVVDATLGSGGHSEEILKKIGKTGRLIAIDWDKKNIERFEKKIESSERKDNVFLINDNFSNLESILNKLGINKVDGVLADLGYSSDQLEDPEYGMSFQKESDLDMRLSRENELTAWKVVNEYEKCDLERIFREFGEERFASLVARKIIERRAEKMIDTTVELAEIAQEAIPKRFHKKIDPATRIFQAIRIEVNGELSNLKKMIDEAISVLHPFGRLAIISFHSLEDRIVKHKFRENAGGCICPENFPQCVCGRSPLVSLVTKRPVLPAEKEIRENPRSRSAKLRVCEKK